MQPSYRAAPSLPPSHDANAQARADDRRRREMRRKGEEREAAAAAAEAQRARMRRRQERNREKLEEWYKTMPLVQLVPRVLSRRHDPRGCLGLDAAASAGAVRKRYLHLALRLHPDKAKHPQAPEAFTAIEAAWQKLRPAA